MKKSIRVLTCLFMLLTLTTIWTAAVASNQQYSFQKDDTEYTVEFNDTTLTAEQQEEVAYRLVYNEESNVQIYGLTCTLFGHKLTESTVSVITHKVYQYAPRCKREIYDVTVCERCDYQTQTLTSISYLDCCPEE